MREPLLKAFLPTSNKICFASSHPVQPWVALVDKNSGAQIWNWQTGEILFTAQFGGIDESAMHYHSLQKMAEVDPAYWGNKVAQEQFVSKTPSGKLKAIEFMDVETLYWKRISQLSIIKGRAGEFLHGSIPGAITVLKERWLVFACENKILFHEMLSHKSHELSKIALDSKNPTCITLFSGGRQGTLDDAYIAVGCSDGTIRVISFTTFKTVVRLGYKTPSVSCLLAVPMSQNQTLLLSGTQEGNLYSFDPFPSVAASGNTLSPLTTLTKAHDNEILSMALGFTTSKIPQSGLFVLGADRSVTIYELPGLKLMTKFRVPGQKLWFHSMDICQPLEASPDPCPVLLGAQNMIHGTTATGTNIFKMIDPATLLPTASKKGPKIYHFALHPLQKQFIFLAMNAGAAVVKLRGFCLGTTVSLPVAKTPKKTLELTCIRLKGQSLVQTEFMSVQQETSEGHAFGSVPETIMDREVLEISDIFGFGGHYRLDLSPDSSKLVLTRTDQNKFVILNHTTSHTWIVVIEGEGSYVVWNATSDKVAVLDTPLPMQATGSQRMLGRLLSKSDSLSGSLKDIPPSIKILDVASKTTTELDVQEKIPWILHGGPLLGIALGGGLGTNTSSFVFHSWDTLQSCSHELEPPEWLIWSDGLDLCAFVYETHILLFHVEDTFRPLTSLPIVDAVSGLWKNNLLYISTQSSIECIVVQRSKQNANLNAILSFQVIVLASFRNGPNWLTGMVESSNRAQTARPCGHLKLLNANRGKIWLVNTREQPVTIDVTYPGFLALESALDDEFSAARVAASAKLSSDMLGGMFLTMGKRSAIEALKLPGLSLPLRLKTAIEARYLKHALLCLKAILNGCHRPEAVVRLPEFRETLKDESSPSLKLVPSASLGKSPFSAFEAAFTAPTSLVAATRSDTIDWDLPLKAYTEKQQKLSIEGEREVLELGMALHDAAVEERMYEIADSAASLVIQNCNISKDGDLLIQLETKLSAREQIQRLKDLIVDCHASRKSRMGQLQSKHKTKIMKEWMAQI